MRYLVAKASTTVAFTPSTKTELDSITLAVTDGSGEAVTLSHTPTWDSSDSCYYLNVDPIDIPDTAVDELWTFVWEFRQGGVYGRAVDRYLVVEEVPQGLIPVSDARAYCSLDDNTSDRFLDDLILAASDAIRTFTGCAFSSPAKARTQYEYVYGTKTVFINECVSVDSVTDLNGAPLAYKVIPGNNGFVRWIELDSRHTGTVAVHGSFGYQEVPESVRQACRVTVKAWFDRDRATFVTGVDLTTGFLERPRALPSSVVGLLQPFRHSQGRM